jgi:hypothetical protein
MGAKYEDIGIRLIGDAGDDVAAGSTAVGEVWVSSPSLALGYQGDNVKTQESFVDEWDAEQGEFIRYAILHVPRLLFSYALRVVPNKS